MSDFNTNKYGRAKKQTQATKTAIVILSVVIVAIIAGVVVFTAMYAPILEKGLPIETNKPDVTTAAEPAVTGEAQPDDDYKRSADVQNFLLMGKDYVGYLTDTIMIISVNSVTDKISVVQIPRDTYTSFGTTYHNINTLYGSFYMEGYYAKKSDPSKYAMEKIVEALEKNLCIQIDRYALINLSAFAEIVDDIGGVWIDVPQDMKYNDPAQDLYIDLKKGYQLLDGDKSEQFVRFRSDYLEGDVGRVDAQKYFMSALLKQVKTSVNISTVSSLCSTVLKNLTTDITLADAVYYSKLFLTSVDLSNITMITLPGEEGREEVDSGPWYYIMNRKAALEVVNKYLNVFASDITDDMFDMNKNFLNHDSERLSNKYYSETITYDVYSANKPEEIDILWK